MRRSGSPGTTGVGAKARRWGRAGGWAIADRALFSLSNFLISLLLARWLSESAYGTFALALAAFLLAGALHGGWVTEPLLVFGSSRYKERFAEYVGFLLRRHLRFSLWAIMAGLGLALAARVIGRPEAGLALAAATLATPWILLQWLGRLACYASVGPRRAAIAGGVQLLLVVVGLVGFEHFGVLSTEAAFGLLGFSGGLTGALLVFSLRPRWKVDPIFTDEARVLHRRYGGWAASTGLLTWIPGQVYYVVLPAVGAVAAAGNLRALMNLVLPLMQAYVALSTVLTTALARVRGTTRFGRVVGYASAGLALGALAYAAMLLAAGPVVMTWLYKGRYDDLAQLLPIVAVIPLLGVGASVLAPALRALERPDLVFVAYAASTVSSLTVGMVLMVRFGVAGAAGGLVISTAVTTVILGWKLVTTRSRGSGHAPGGRSADVSTGSVSGSSTIANSASE